MRAWVPILAVAALSTGTWAAWHARPRVELRDLEALAREALADRFGPDVEAGALHLMEGSRLIVEDVRAPRLSATQAGIAPEAARDEGLVLGRLDLAVDPLALLAGRVVAKRIAIDDAQIPLREIEAGVAADFFIAPPDPDDPDPTLPEIALARTRVVYRAMPSSRRLAPSARLEAQVLDLRLEPDSAGGLRLRGALTPIGLGQPDAKITVNGRLDPDLATFEVEGRWDPLELTPALLDQLAPEVAGPLRQDSIRTGSLAMRLQRASGGLEGPVAMRIDWDSDVEVQAEDLPGTVYFDAKTRKQLAELFGRGALKAHLEAGRVGIDRLFSELAGGEVSASGWIDQENDALELDFRIRGLALHDPALRQALGEEGAALFDQFDPSGVVNAVGRVTREPGGELDWEIDVLLEAAAFRFVGLMDEEVGAMDGFPYPVRDATGRVQIGSDGVTFGEIVGFNRGTQIRILGHKTGRTWTDPPGGHETGRVRFGTEGPDVRLSVVVQDMPMDARVREAIAGSVFADVFDDLELQGVIDRVEVDVIALPGIDTAAKTEVRIVLEGEQFRYRPFPLPLEDVRGVITMRRPLLSDGTRGRVYAFEVEGWADGSRVVVKSEIVEHEQRGRLTIDADGLALDGSVADIVMGSALTADELGPIWAWLHPEGRADIRADFPVGGDPGPLRLSATLRDARMGLDGANAMHPLVFEELSGRLEIEGDALRLEGLRGTLEGSAVSIRGTMSGGTAGTWRLQADAPRLVLTKDVLAGVRELLDEEALLPGGLRPEPGGTLGLTLSLSRPAVPSTRPATEGLRVEVVARDLEAEVLLPDGAPARVAARRVTVRGAHIESEGLRLERDGLRLEVDAAEVHTAEGAPRLRGAIHLHLRDHVLSTSELDLMPPEVRDLLTRWAGDRQLNTQGLTVEQRDDGAIHIAGLLGFSRASQAAADSPGPLGQISLEPLVVRTDPELPDRIEGRLVLIGFTHDARSAIADVHGVVEVAGLSLGAAPEGQARLAGMRGRIAGIPVSALAANLEWSDAVLEATQVRATVAGGQLGARLRLHTSAPAAYEGHLRIDGWDLRRLLTDLGSDPGTYRGRGQLALRFSNTTGHLTDLTAAGRAQIRRGRLGEVPSVASLPTLLGSLTGERSPQLQQADAAFVLAEESIWFRQLELRGPHLRLPGRGTIDLDGTADLVFTPDILKNLLLPGSMEIPGLAGALRRLLPESGLYTVRLRGPLGTAEPEVITPLGGR